VVLGSVVWGLVEHRTWDPWLSGNRKRDPLRFHNRLLSNNPGNGSSAQLGRTILSALGQDQGPGLVDLVLDVELAVELGRTLDPCSPDSSSW